MKLNSVLGFKFNGKVALFESGFVKGFSKDDVLARNIYFFNFEKDRGKRRKAGYPVKTKRKYIK
jgi:hypothetical protein